AVAAVVQCQSYFPGFNLSRFAVAFPLYDQRAGQFVLISKSSQQWLQFRQIRNVRAKSSAITMPPAEIVNRVPADEIVPRQISADIVQVDDVVPNDALRSEL